MTKLQTIDTQISLTHLAVCKILHWAQGCNSQFWGRENWQFLSGLLPCCFHRWQSSMWLLLARADKPEKARVFSGRVKHWNLMLNFQAVILVVLFGRTCGWVRFPLPSEGEELRAGLGEGSRVRRSSWICSACSFSSSMYSTQSKISPSSSLRRVQILTAVTDECTQVDDWITFYFICFNHSHRSGSKCLFSSSFGSSLCSSFANK